MKSWKGIGTLTALILGLTTLSQGLVTRYEFDLGGLSQDEAFSAMCLQGIENRNGPYLYYFISNHPSIYGPHYSHLWSSSDTAWQNWYKTQKGYSFTPIASFTALLNLCKNDVNSNLVVYDPQVAGEEAVAATYAGVYTCLPVSGAVLNRNTPASKGMIGWVEDPFASIDAWKIVSNKCPPPPPETLLVGPGGNGDSDYSALPVNDGLRLHAGSNTQWISAWLYGASVDFTRYPKVLIRVDSLYGTSTRVVAKYVTIKNGRDTAYVFGPPISHTGICTLTTPGSPQSGEEPVYFEVQLYGDCGADKIARIDWVSSADNSGNRIKRSFVDEEFSDTLYWRASPNPHRAYQRIVTRKDSSQALRCSTNVAINDSCWTTNAGDTVDLNIFPKIQIKVDSLSSGVQWKLTAKNGITEYVVKNWNTQIGVVDTNLKAITGFSDKRVFDFKIKLKKTSSGAKVGVFNWLRSRTAPMTESGWTKVKDLMTVAEQKKFPMQQWARDSLLSYTTSSHKALSGNNGLNTYVGVDYIVQKQGYVFRLDNNKQNNEGPLMGQILEALYTGNEPVAVYGYFDKDSIYYGEYNDEGKYFTFLTRYGAYAMVTPAPNLSFHNQVPASLPSQRHLPTLTLDTTKHYVALMLSEGDTPKFAFSFFGGSWKRDAAKGTIPFNWGINPVFSEVCPSILEYYYSTNQSDSNYFFAGCSGVGATLPWYFPSAKLTDYANLFERVGPLSDISISDIWQADFEPGPPNPPPPPYSNSNIKIYADTAINVKGFTVMQDAGIAQGQIPWGHLSFVRDSNQVPVIRVYKSLHYWVTYYDSTVYDQGWTYGRTRHDTLHRCPADQEVAWDSIGTANAMSKWQKVAATRLWGEYLHHNQKTPFFTALFSAPKPDSQVVTFAKGVRDSLNNLAPGKFVFVTLEQMMDLAKQARLLGSVEINHNAKFTNSLACTLNLWSYADSVKAWDGTTSRGFMPIGEDTLHWTFPSGDGVKRCSVQYKVGKDTTPTFTDSIIVDTEAPYAEISSPISGQMVSGMVPFDGYASDWFQHHLSLWEIYQDASPWCSGINEVGMMWPIQMPGHFGDWNSTVWPNGDYQHSLMVNDSAGNQSQDTVTVYVNNAGGGDGGDGFASGFGTSTSIPMNVTTDASGNVYFAETQGNRIRKHSPNKDSLFAFSTRRNSDTSGTTWPTAMALKDSTVLWVADGLNDCIKQFDREGNLLLRFGSHGRDTGDFDQPCGIALDWKGRLWITDRLNNRIQVYDTTGTFLFGFGRHGSDSGKLDSPSGVTITKSKQAWITDTKNNQLQIFDSLGNWVKTIKQPDSLGFDTPTGICTDKYGDIFIADTKNHRIVELNPFGRRLFIFGSQGDSLCQFRNPIGVASSPGGHYLYVADMGNKRVTRFTVIRGDTTGGGPQGGVVVQLPPVNFLGPARPNPTRGEVQIAYGLAKESPVNLKIYNVAGQMVREFNQGKQKAGYYSITWDGRSNLGHKVGAGVYFYRLQAGNWVKTRKMIVIR